MFSQNSSILQVLFFFLLVTPVATPLLLTHPDVHNRVSQLCDCSEVEQCNQPCPSLLTPPTQMANTSLPPPQVLFCQSGVYQTTITIRSIYPDGDCVFAMVWCKFSDCFSCSFVRIRNGGLEHAYQPLLDPGKRRHYEKNRARKCLAAVGMTQKSCFAKLDCGFLENNFWFLGPGLGTPLPDQLGSSACRSATGFSVNSRTA